MTETFFKSVALRISAFRMNLGEAEFLLSRSVITERSVEPPIEVKFENEKDEDRRNSGDPKEGFDETVLQTNG
jgi:hypothetical protein